MPGADPIDVSFSWIDGHVKQGHEPAAFENIPGEMTVHGGNNLGNGAGLRGAHPQKRAGRGHQQGRIHTVAGNVADHDAEGSLSGVTAAR